MDQQVNLYRPEFRPETNAFQSRFMFQAAGALLLVLALIYAFARSGVEGVDEELVIVAGQEAAAIERLEKVRPIITAVTGEQSWSAQLDDATHTLAERQAVLTMIQGTTLGDTRGFSRHLRALARQDVDGLWLTRIVLSALGDRTQIDGRATRAELIPLYVQNLAAEPAFEQQRFHQFQIDNPVDDGDPALSFSMNSRLPLVRNEVVR